MDILNLGDAYISHHEVEKIKNHFGIHDERKWTEERRSGITVYNLVNIDFHYPEIKEEVIGKKRFWGL